MPADFWTWFDDQQRELALNDSAVARQAGIAHSVISKARGGLQAIGHEALAKIAPVLDTPVATAFAMAGYIDKRDALTPEQAAVLQLWGDVPDERDREEMLAILKVRAKRGRREKRLHREKS